LGSLVEVLRHLPNGDFNLPGRMATIISQRKLVQIRNDTLGHGYSRDIASNYLK
jgi:hypothetical protein